MLAISPAKAQDKITLKSGDSYLGKIREVKNGQVFIQVEQGNLPFRLNLVEVVEMDAPRELVRARTAEPKKQLALVAPLINKYKGLPADWVVESLGIAAEAYAALGQNDKAKAVYSSMLKLYPNSIYEVRAKAGLAGQALATGNTAEALKMIKPLIAEANKTLLPGNAQGQVYGAAYLVQGQALEKQGKLADALSSYLTVVTVFHQNPSVAQAAQEAAAALRKKNPDVIVE